MNEVLQAFLCQLGASPETIQDAVTAAEPMELPTRHVLLNQGEQPAYCYFLLDGLCHACYLTAEGKQFSKEFYWDQDVLIGFESLINDMPSPFLLETLSASKLLALPVSLLQRWREQKNPLYIRLLERQLSYKEQKERFMLMHSPEERYQLFTSSFPELLSRIADYQIASYLGITPISLSRIKKRLEDVE
ncbi:Crp/Fnr family transcriptional regulator [Photobacterium chitinilyticum]|uniref:Crp/Fnr family transcriptional regulator n=1 Tax=Photobacterium chitinilyticum TaxID=2485123 RepID=A0A3S3R5S6_9GAMM|nr:Crp/Fnr family transcriptional regulator [Photobacterium chitinilyticum]RWX53003.1 Crp/Fnr family transcriptional regulator [Photobacterium chitinilyticum]